MYTTREPKLFKIVSNENYETGRLNNRYKIELENYSNADLLDTKQYVEAFYEKFLYDTSTNKLHSGILGFVSQFGNGKSFFLQYLYCYIFDKLPNNSNNNQDENSTSDNFKVLPIYIDISKFEHLSQELLLSILSEIITQLDLLENSDKKGISNAKTKMMKLLPKAFKAISTGALSIATGGKEDLLISAIGEFTEEFGLSLINTMNKEEEFLKKLQETIVELENSSFLIILDNLDRCRPEFVLELLVLLKRLFDVERITFILSYDKRQIINLLQTKYSVNVDIQSYIKKYISYEYYMPQYKNISKFTLELLENSLSKFTNIDNNTKLEIKQKLQNMNDSFDSFDSYIEEQQIDENDKSKIILAYIWQYTFLHTTLSLRKYEQGFIHISHTSTINGMENAIFFIELLYIKFNFPSEYQAINYMIDDLQTHISPKYKFWKEMNKLHQSLKLKMENLEPNSKLQNTFENTFNNAKKDFQNIYLILEGHRE